jgi:hypothetical protein
MVEMQCGGHLGSGGQQVLSFALIPGIAVIKFGSPDSDIVLFIVETFSAIPSMNGFMVFIDISAILL